jgi:excisionase family DNA binding protein
MRPALLSINATRRELGDRSRSTVYELIDQGEIEAVRAGRRRLVVGASIDRYVAKLRRIPARNTPSP